MSKKKVYSAEFKSKLEKAIFNSLHLVPFSPEMGCRGNNNQSQQSSNLHPLKKYGIILLKKELRC